MITLGIETSCDETAICLIETEGESYRILANIVNSQIDLHKEYGGVFPMLAKREHIKNLPIIYQKILEESKIKESQINHIAVTQGPGLEPALWTGILFAKELSDKLKIPLIPINHMEGHVLSSLIKNVKSNDFQTLRTLEFPTLAILISGGHTEIVKVNNFNSFEILGKTVDDAIGEAFDKVARMLGFPYPGGPQISKLAEEARNEGVLSNIKLPRPMLYSKDLNFSFSGLKTSVLYKIKELGEINVERKKDIAREFEDAVTEVLIHKTRKAIEENEVKLLLIGGGVIANKHIRKSFLKLAEEYSIPIFLPEDELCGDNAIMIAIASIFKINDIDYKDQNSNIKAVGNLSISKI